jgi:hypothetical protein
VSLQSRDIHQLLRKMATAQQKASWMQNAFCCAVVILQHGLPWRRRPETFSRVNYKKTLRVFLTVVVHHVIVGSLATSLKTCKCVTFFLHYPAYLRVSVLTLRNILCGTKSNDSCRQNRSSSGSGSGSTEATTNKSTLW